jgi:hypothetical protein
MCAERFGSPVLDLHYAEYIDNSFECRLDSDSHLLSGLLFQLAHAHKPCLSTNSIQRNTRPDSDVFMTRSINPIPERMNARTTIIIVFDDMPAYKSPAL